MDFQQFPHLSKRARALHNVIRTVAMFRPPAFHFIDEETLEHSIRLLRQRFRKPLMSKSRAWAEGLVAHDVKAYLFMSRFIELKLGGQRWTTWGMLVHPLEQLNADAAELLLGNIGPCYFRIDLGRDPEPFHGLLENLKLSPDTGEVIEFERGVA